MKQRRIVVTGLTLLVASVLSAQVVPGRSPVTDRSRLPGRYAGIAERYQGLLLERERWYDSSLDELYESYRRTVEAATAEDELRDAGRAAVYLAELETILAETRAQRDELVEQEQLLRAEFLSLLQTEPPVPGSASARGLFEWTAATVRDTPQRQAMVRELLNLELSTRSADERNSFLSAVDGTLFAPDVLRSSGSLLAGDAVELLLIQLIVVPAVALPEFAATLSDALAALGSSGIGSGAELERLSNLDRIEQQITQRTVSATALAALTPGIFSLHDEPVAGLLELEQTLGRELRLVRSSEGDLVSERTREVPAVAFLVERADSLLVAAGRAETRRFADRTGSAPHEITRLTQDLYTARATPARPSLLDQMLWREARADPTASPASLPPFYPPVTPDNARSTILEPSAQRVYRLYLQLGEENAEAVAALEQSDDPRSGDDYRWTMLGALSHPYALHLLATQERYERAGRLLDQFVASVYERAGRISGFPLAFRDREALLGFGRYERTVVVDGADQVSGVYQAFVQAAQDLDVLPESYLDEYAPGISQAEHWAHLHGLHVSAVEGLDTEVPRRAVRWFELSALAEVPDEQFAHAVRGLYALASPSDLLPQYAPQLASASAWSEAASRFQRPTPEAYRLVALRLGFSSRDSRVLALQQVQRVVRDRQARLAPVRDADVAAFARIREGEDL